MSSLGDVGAALGRALDKIDQSMAAHQQAADLVEEARDLLAVAGEGSSHGDVEQARASLTAVVDGIVEPEGQLSKLAHAAELIRDYATRQGISETAPSPAAPLAPTPSVPTTPKRPDPGSPEHVAALRDQLPPAVQPRSGQKTHGRWFTGHDDAQPIVSGEDADATEAWQILKDSGFPRMQPPMIVSHVEIKLAARMKRENIRHASVVINNVPCGDILGCENILPAVLPEGYSLTVHGPDYKKTFQGGQPPWRRR